MTPLLKTFLRKSSSILHLLPNLRGSSVRFSLVCESKAGFSTRQLTKTQRWFLIWNGLTGAALFFFLTCSTMPLTICVCDQHRRPDLWVATRTCSATWLTWVPPLVVAMELTKDTCWN